METNDKDYSEACIYIIKHKNLDINLPYIGKCINRKQRYADHTSKSYNINDPEFNKELYIFIRNNDGWKNFDFMILEECPCDEGNDKLNDLKLRKREQYWINFYDSINNGLNIDDAWVSVEEQKQKKINNIKKYRENMTIEQKNKKKENNRLSYANRSEEQIKKEQERGKKRNETIRNNPELLDKKRKQSRESAAKPWTCIICNITINRGSRCRHLKTQSHLDKVANS